MQRHAEGLKYTERNAGSQIDSEMVEKGRVLFLLSYEWFVMGKSFGYRNYSF